MYEEFKTFIRERMDTGARRCGVRIPFIVQQYTADTLASFIRPDNPVLPHDVMSQTIVSLWAEALEAPPFMRYQLYRRIGDLSLIMCGLYPKFVDKTTGSGYYIDMGQFGYDRAYSLSKTKNVMLAMASTLPQTVASLQTAEIIR